MNSLVRKRVVFARINRRLPQSGQPPISDSSFSTEIRILAESRKTQAVQPGRGGKPKKTWFAGDFDVTPDGNFLTGTLGYSEKRTDRSFDFESWSWIKGEEEKRDSGSDETVVTFAVDLRDDERWVAFTTASRLQVKQFRFGLELILQTAVSEADLLGYQWEVDLVTSRRVVDDWIAAHPDVFFLKRTVKFSNPGYDLSDDEEEMRKLGAKRKAEEFAAPPNDVLDVQSNIFQEKIEGVETGFLDLDIYSRGEKKGSTFKFKSKESAEFTYIEVPNREAERDGVLFELAQRSLNFFKEKESGY